VEEPGRGLRAWLPDGEVRLGRRDFAGAPAGPGEPDAGGPELWLARPGRAPVRFAFGERLRVDARATLAHLMRRGYAVELLSGDHAAAVGAAAGAAGIAAVAAGRSPAGKCERLAALAARGRRVLMVGDGLNDAPALAAAHVSLAPASGADIAQSAADAVFQGDRLAPVALLLDVARRAAVLVRQNFALAIGYNLVAVPVAMAGLLTPLIAALLMSGSSIVVVLSSLRLSAVREPR
jgi:Cu2+-exporting ATPase